MSIEDKFRKRWNAEVTEESELLDTLQEHQRNQDKVQIEYSRPYWVSPFDCSSGLSIVREASTASGGAAP